MSETFGQALRRQRQEARLSQPQLARAVYVTQSFISKVETGAELPSPEFAQACDDALAADGALASLVSDRRRPSATIDAWRLADALTRTSLSVEALDLMRGTVLSYAGSYPQATPGQLLEPVSAHLLRLEQALSRPQPLAVRREIVRLAGLLSGIAGNLALDVQRHDQAEGYFDVALLAGREAEDQDLAAWALATRSLVPFFESRHADAGLRLLEAGRVARTGASSRRRAWIAALHARAAAAAGDRALAQKQLDQASTALSVADSPTETDFFDAARLAALAGATLLLLGKTDEAEHVLVAALSARAVGDRKGRALTILDLAACRLLQGDPAEATSLVADALTVAGTGPVGPIVLRARSIAADMIQADPRSAEALRSLLADSRPTAPGGST
jgi:DNA-binding XRE family transcriptional regulator